MNATKILLMAMVVLVGTVGVAGANGHSCTDGKGNPHYCWQPDVDPTFSITTQTATATVQVNHIVTVQSDCEGDGTYALSGGYKVMPKDAKVGYVVKAKVLNNGPVFSVTAEDSSPHGWAVTVVNHGAQAAIVTTYATCIQSD
ncbi:MAG TPA: hypothetical protein VNE82_09950 [Candidatus Binataceae bacterium]|nr:hypothetical protein [Candidatus Binataceae bacterium]